MPLPRFLMGGNIAYSPMSWLGTRRSARRLMPARCKALAIPKITHYEFSTQNDQYFHRARKGISNHVFVTAALLLVYFITTPHKHYSFV